MKDKKNIENQIELDAAFIREHIEKNGVKPAVPVSVSEDVIVKSIAEKKPKSYAKHYVSAAVSLAAVFVVVIALAITGTKNIHHERAESNELPDSVVVPEDSGIETVSDYSEVLEIFKKANPGNPFGWLNGWTSDDMAPEAGQGYNYTVHGAEGSEWNFYGGSDMKGDSAEDAVVDSYSELNQRDENVAEADCVRTDGKYIYICASGFAGNIAIVQPSSDGTMKLVKTVECEKDFTVEHDKLDIAEMYISDGRLIAAFSAVRYSDYKGWSGVMIYDVTDIDNPSLVKVVHQDGDLVATRITDGKLYIISNYCPGYHKKYTVENTIPEVTCDCLEGTFVNSSNILILDRENLDGWNVITSVKLDNLDETPVTEALLGNGWNVYCTADRLFIHSEEWDKSADCDSISVKAFDITGDTIEYAGCCKAEGWMLGDFSIDWNGEYLRIASTDRESAVLTIYDSDLNEVAKLDGFGKGETVRGVRFMGNTAYIVTFFQTDPLFVIDLTDNTKPVIVGELKMPGFSDYLHPVGENLLLGIGEGGTETGTDGSAKASLYDVSDPANPVELDSVIIKDASFFTAYKAFTQVPGENTYLVPVNRWSIHSGTDENGIDYYGWQEYSTGVAGITVTADKKLELSAEYSIPCPGEDGEVWYYIERSVVINGTVFAVDNNSAVFSFRSSGEYISMLDISDCFFSDKTFLKGEAGVYYYGDGYGYSGGMAIDE